MKFYSDVVTFNTIKEMFANFTLIENEENFSVEIEQNKHLTKKLTEKILNNISQEILAWGDDLDSLFSLNEELTNDELKQLQNLLNEHENRVIFLQKLSNFRTQRKFKIKEKDYFLLGNLFNIICDTVIRDSDFHSADLTIILAETYYITEKGENKKYLHDFIKNNKLFQNIQFWKEFFNYCIEKKNKKNTKIDENLIETSNESKITNIFFAISATLINNMASFDVGKNEISEVIKSNLNYDKLNDGMKKIIDSLITEKEEESKLKTEDEC